MIHAFTTDSFGIKYTKTISMLNKIYLDKEYNLYFHNKNTYIPLVIIRIQEPRFNPFSEQPNLIIKDGKSYKVHLKNTTLLEKKKDKKIEINSKYSFDVNIFQEEEEEFINHLKKHKIYIKTMHTYLNGYYEKYLMVYYTKYYNNFQYENDFNFLILSNPKPIIGGSKCIIC